MFDPDSAGPETDDGEQAALDLLTHGTLEIEGRLVDASNATLYCTIKTTRPDPRAARDTNNPKNPKDTKNPKNPKNVRAQHATVACVYKPIAGERPLWDFPAGTLAGREVAAYVVSRAAGWDVVPPTVMRDGPFGPGMCQLWIDHDTGVDLIALSRRTDHAGLRDMAVFDAVVNNADRKIGHLLPDRAVQALRKLDTALGAELGTELSGLLTRDEIDVTRDRVKILLEDRVHPYPPDGWPA
ncbi:MAG TPA: hypothetical protein VJ347_11995, partial [Streptosporangiaceae bacterium]|nr:hypothetical protein [Streptosporangiaceae bacterium]